MVSGSLGTGIEELTGLDSVGFAESEVLRIESHIRRLRGRQAELLAELDTHQIAHAEGARTMADWVSARLDLSPQAASRLMTVARTDQPEIRRRMMAGEWGIDRASVVAKLAAAGIPADQLIETADSFSIGRLYGLLERTRRLDAESEAFDYDWRYLVCQPSLDESVFKLWGQLPGTDGQVVLNALSARETELAVLEDQTSGQRRADALTSICLDSLTGSDGDGEAGRAVTVAEIFVDATLAAATGGEAGAATISGIKVGPNTLGEILCGGKVRVINATETHPISYSDLSDTVPPAIRSFVRWRDQGACSIEGCRSRYRVQPHHIKERQHGGNHHPDNLISLCWYHHHVAIHQRGLTIDPESSVHRRKLTWPERGPPD